MAQGTITDEDKKFVETWESIARYQNGVIKLDIRGDLTQEVIHGGRKFMITTEERLLTQDRIVEDKHDPFLNGAFRPIVVPDNVTATTNPNALSDDEIFQIFVASDIAFEEWLKTLDSPATLGRMVDMAEESDELSMKRFKAIKARLLELKPQARIQSSDPQVRKFLEQEGRDRSQRGGGRSRDYRDD